MANLDPQVQIRILDLAEKGVEATKEVEAGHLSQEARIERRAKAFGTSYTTIVERLCICRT